MARGASSLEDLGPLLAAPAPRPQLDDHASTTDEKDKESAQLVQHGKPARLKALRNSEQVQAMMAEFFARQMIAIVDRKSDQMFKELPLARIKRIMKQDACEMEPRMISADAIATMAYASQLFVGWLTKLAWAFSTQPDGRNTLQVKDLKAAVFMSDKFDFLVDVLDIYDRQTATEKGRPLS
jgi:histone H3/H4